MTHTDHLEDRLRAALATRAREIGPAADAWQHNQRRLAIAGRDRSRRVLGVAAAGVAVAVAVGAAALLGGGRPGGVPADGGSDPWDGGNILGEPVMTETLTLDGEQTRHELVLTDTTGEGPVLCDRFVGATGSAGGCASREPAADDRSVAFDWLSGTEGGGDIRGVVAAVDDRVSKVRIWMDNGDMTLAVLMPGGWDDTQLFAMTVPTDGPVPQRLVGYGRDGRVLQAVDLPTRFGETWLKPHYACAGDRVADSVPDGDVFPNAYIALGTDDASISVRLDAAAGETTCVEKLQTSAVAGWFQADSLVVVVLGPEVERVRIVDDATVLAEVEPRAVGGSPLKVVTEIVDQGLQDMEVVAYDRQDLELGREFLSQPATP